MGGGGGEDPGIYPDLKSFGKNKINKKKEIDTKN
jgi:hypothetical protein